MIVYHTLPQLTSVYFHNSPFFRRYLYIMRMISFFSRLMIRFSSREM